MTPSHEDPPADSGEYLVLSRGQWDADATPEAIQSAIDAFYPWLEAHIAAGRMKTGERLARAGAFKAVHHEIFSDCTSTATIAARGQGCSGAAGSLGRPHPTKGRG